MSDGAPHAVLLAGGAGVRLWPVSRERRPKQFFRFGAVSLLEMAFSRGLGIVRAAGGGAAAAPGNVWAVVTEPLAQATRQELPALLPEQLLVEAARRNTAAAIGWAAVEVRRRAGPAAVLAVLPADHHVADPDAFARAGARACAHAAGGALVTIGIPPTRPETGYGWLELDAGTPLAGGAFPLKSFVEKPDRARAEAFLAAGAGRFLWNAGIFFFRADRILEEIARHMPVLGRALEAIAADPARAAETYRALPADLPSIDYGVMERAERIVCVPAPAEVGWDDVGSWAALRNVLPRRDPARPPEEPGVDDRGNATLGEALLVDSTGCVVDARGLSVVSVVGMRDVCVVATGDAVLVCPLDQAQRVREVVEELRRRGKKEVL